MTKSAASRNPSGRAAWRIPLAFSLAALACGMLLGGVSAWLLGSVAIAGLTSAALTFNFHIPAALIRLFALGRTAARYGERLTGHKAALDKQVVHRAALFGAMAGAASVRRASWQFGDQARLSDYLDDVEDLDYARLRVDLPLLSAVSAFAAGLVATAIVAPLACLPILVAVAIILAVGAGTSREGALTWGTSRQMRRVGAAQLGAAMSSAIPLRAEGAWREQCTEALDRFSAADLEMLTLRRRQARFDFFAGLFAPVAALSVIGSAWLAGERSAVLLPAAFVAFAWFAFGEATNGGSRVLLARLRRRLARAEIGESTERPDSQGGAESIHVRTPSVLSHSALRVCAPDGRSLGVRAALRLKAGHPTVIVGQSGCGKTSLLKQIAGWIGEDEMTADAQAISADERRAMAMICLHDAAIFADTVRANLFASSRSDAELWAALTGVEMEERIRKVGGLDSWITQETFSMGEAQRLNLARAWLSDKAMVLLDEPTEHLDEAQGQRILAKLLRQLQNQIVALSTHRMNVLQNAAVVAL